MRIVLGVLLLATICVTLWGILVVPAGSRFPVSYGVPPSIEGTINKPLGLGAFFLIQTVLVLGSLQASEMMTIQVIGAVLIAFFLLVQIHLIRRMR